VTLISPNLRQSVVQRAGNRCEYCHLPQASQVATFPIDHVVPSCLRGETALYNLALSCPRCNARKWLHVHALDPITGKLEPLFNPRQHGWDEHFRWDEFDPAVLTALTSIGRATISLLDLNSVQHLLVRRWLLELGVNQFQSLMFQLDLETNKTLAAFATGSSKD
jgi:hypothetical protein